MLAVFDGQRAFSSTKPELKVRRTAADGGAPQPIWITRRSSFDRSEAMQEAALCGKGRKPPLRRWRPIFVSVEVRAPAEIDGAFQTLARERVEIVIADRRLRAQHQR